MRKLWVVVKREYLERVRSKWFLVGTLFVPALIVASFLLPAFLTSRSTASSGVRNVIILDATGVGIGERVAADLLEPTGRGRLGAGATADTIGPRPDVRIVERARLAEAESTATREVMREGGWVGYVVLDDRTVSGMTARYAGRNATSFRDVDRIRNAVSRAVMLHQLREAGANPRMVDVIARTRVRMPAERITDRGRGGSGQVGALLAIGIAFLFYISIVVHGQNVLRGVLEEKMTRVAEVVISSVRPETLLAGKVLGVGAVGLTQQVIWVVASAVLINKLGPLVMRMGGDAAQTSAAGSIMQAFTGVSVKLLVLLLLFFLVGYIFYAALHAAIGSMVNSEQEAQQAALPVMFLLIGTFIFVQPILLDPTGTLAIVMSWLPFSSPIIMPLRMTVIQIPTATLVSSLAIGVAACAAVVWLAGRIYRVGMLMYGKRPTMRELIRWIRYA
ncbi:MAG: ABC transporter permease [Gemmatimonadaceae bacterium]